MNVGTDQVPVPEIDAGWRHRSGDHPGRLAVEVLIVRAAPGAVGEHQGGLPTASRASAALRVVGGGRRYVAQVDEIELGDVDAKLHGRGAEQQRQLTVAKALLAFLAILRRHLSSVFPCFENAIQIDEAAIAPDEVAVHLRGQSALVEQAGPLHRTVLAVAGQPAQGVGVELVAGVVGVPAVANLLDDAVALQRQEQELDGLVRLGTPEGLPGLQMRGESAPEVLPVSTVGRDEVTPLFSLPAGARPSDDGARQLSFVVQIPHRAFLETQLRLLDEVVLRARVEDVDLHGKRPANDIEKGPDDLLLEIGGGAAKRGRGWGRSVPACVRRAR